MKSSPAHTWIVEITAALLILLFAYTGISKLRDQEIFQLVISKSPVVAPFAMIVSWLLPLIELSTVLLLLIPTTKKIGFWISLVMMTIFTCYIGFMLMFSSKLPCSCGGILRQMSWEHHLIFNIFFTVLTGISIRLYNKNQLFIAINRGSRKPVEKSKQFLQIN